MAKITNEMRYKTAEDRVKAFGEFCDHNICDKSCAAYGNLTCETSECMARWLSLEAEEEKPEPCPFCGKECRVLRGRIVSVSCSECNYMSSGSTEEAEAIATHNRMARAVRDVQLAHETMNKIENSTIGFCDYEKETILSLLKQYGEVSCAVRAAKNSNN